MSALKTPVPSAQAEPHRAPLAPFRAARRAMRALVLVFVSLLVSFGGLALGTGCASTGGAMNVADGGGAVSLVENGQTFALISDGFLASQGVPGDNPAQRRDAFYSVARDNGLVKVISDSRLGELVQFLEASGFGRAADEVPPGTAAITVDVNGARRALPKPDTSVPAQIDRPALRKYTDMKGAFVQVFNETQGFQNVAGSDVEFEQPKLSPNLMRYVTGTAAMR